MSRVFLLETKAESDPEDHLDESDLPLFDAIQNKNIEAIRKHAKELDSCFCRQGSSRNDLSIFRIDYYNGLFSGLTVVYSLDTCIMCSILWIDVAGKHPSPWQFETAMQSPCTLFCKAALQPPFLSKAPARLGVLSALCL